MIGIILIIMILLICYGLTYLKNKKNSKYLNEEIIKKYTSQLEDISNDNMEHIKKRLENFYYPDTIIMPYEITNKKDFKKSFSEINTITHFIEKKRNVY